MLIYNITNWFETHKKLKWRKALRIATQSPDRWTRKAAVWNPGLVISTKTQRRAERPASRWEDDLNEFVKDEETEATQSNDLKNKNTLLIVAKNACEWEKKERQSPNTSSMTEEPRPTLTSNNTTANTAATSQRRSSALRICRCATPTSRRSSCEKTSKDLTLLVCRTAHSIPRYTNIDGEVENAVCRILDTLSSHSVSRDSHEPMALNIQRTSLMPAGPDAWHMLDPSTMSVVMSCHTHPGCNAAPSQHRCKSTLLQAARDLSGMQFFNLSCIERVLSP